MRRAIVYSSTSELTRITIDGIRFFKSFFPEGAYFSYMYFKEAPYNQLASTHYQTSGRMVADGGIVHEADWYSREDTSVIRFGPMKLVAEEDTVRWCCTGLADNEPTDYVAAVRIAGGAALSVVAGDCFLVLKGRVETPSKPLLPGDYARIVNSPSMSLTCSEPTVVYKWRTEDVVSNYTQDALSIAKAQKWDLIKKQRNDRDAGGFVYDGGVYDSDIMSTLKIFGAAQRAVFDAGYVEVWTLADNTTRTLNATQLLELVAALGAHASANHNLSKQLRADIDACTTVAEVNGIHWT